MSRLMVLLALATVLAASAGAQHALEIIPLRYRTAEQVLPALRPLLEPGATLTGQGNQLIVRTSPGNLAELARALEAIDRPSRRLQISVRYDDAVDSAAANAGVGGRVGNRGARIEAQAGQRQSQARERGEQRIQVLEGGRAYIATGRSAPVFNGSVMQESASGFEAVPRLAGGRVLVEIMQRRDTPDRLSGLSTTVSAALGEWFELGGAMEQAGRRDSGALSSNHSNIALSRRVWLRVDEVR
jgi:Bacterial type II/III secretion system short domain